jgi:hypothetical protein
MKILRYFLLIFLGLASVVCPHDAETVQLETISITAEPITSFERDNPSRMRFGSLDFRGGLVLSSPYPHFGGFSALRIRPDGETFIALSDRSYWLRGRIMYRDHRPTGIADASMVPMLECEGRIATYWDPESIAEDGNNLFVGLEGLNDIARFDHGWIQPLAHGCMIDVPKELKTLPDNQGLEALVYVPKPFPLSSALLGISERGLTDEGNIRSFIIGGPKPGTFSVKRTNNFDISDAALLPNGDILILERQFSLLSGVAARIRRIPMAAIKPGALVDGATIFEADMRHQIDNFEALSVHRSASGELILTIMSDDNFVSFQRTLLLQFSLKDP